MSSRWYEWLYVGKPLWYFWKQVEGGRVQAVLGTGNLVLWVGAELLALYAVYRKRRSPEVWALAALVFIQFAPPPSAGQQMVPILPFLYVLKEVYIADLDRFLRSIAFTFGFPDLALLPGLPLASVWNYFPLPPGQARPVCAAASRRWETAPKRDGFESESFIDVGL